MSISNQSNQTRTYVSFAKDDRQVMFVPGVELQDLLDGSVDTAKFYVDVTRNLYSGKVKFKVRTYEEGHRPNPLLPKFIARKNTVLFLSSYLRNMGIDDDETIKTLLVGIRDGSQTVGAVKEILKVGFDSYCKVDEGTGKLCLEGEEYKLSRVFDGNFRLARRGREKFFVETIELSQDLTPEGVGIRTQNQVLFGGTVIASTLSDDRSKAYVVRPYSHKVRGGPYKSSRAFTSYIKKLADDEKRELRLDAALTLARSVQTMSRRGVKPSSFPTLQDLLVLPSGQVGLSDSVINSVTQMVDPDREKRETLDELRRILATLLAEESSGWLVGCLYAAKDLDAICSLLVEQQPLDENSAVDLFCDDDSLDDLLVVTL